MFDPGIKVGDIVTNEEMRAAFAVGNMGGTRKSNTHNCLVLSLLERWKAYGPRSKLLRGFLLYINVTADVC